MNLRLSFLMFFLNKLVFLIFCLFAIPLQKKHTHTQQHNLYPELSVKDLEAEDEVFSRLFLHFLNSSCFSFHP